MGMPGRKPLQLENQTFGSWTVICKLDTKPSRWLCICVCGNQANVLQATLRDGTSKQCKNCAMKNRKGKKYNLKHGMHGTPEYRTWDAMKQRCLNKNHRNYILYGGRGITVCDRWLSFENFYKDMGNRPFPKAQLYIIDNDKGYYPANVRWATNKQNSHNRRTCKTVVFKGKKVKVVDLIKDYDIDLINFKNRLLLGWSVEKALLTPIDKSKSHSKKGKK